MVQHGATPVDTELVNLSFESRTFDNVASRLDINRHLKRTRVDFKDAFQNTVETVRNKIKGDDEALNGLAVCGGAT